MWIDWRFTWNVKSYFLWKKKASKCWFSALGVKAVTTYLILVEYIEHKRGKSTGIPEREKLFVDLRKSL